MNELEPKGMVQKTTCPSCGMHKRHRQIFRAHVVGWWLSRRWVARFRCVNCRARFTHEVPPVGEEIAQ